MADGAMTPEEYRSWRDRMGFTHEKAAESLGVTRRTSINYQNGKRAISKTVAELAKVRERDQLLGI
jgi:DNA-binding XRE family transcriptional regulator